MKCPKSNLSTETIERMQSRGKQICAERRDYSYSMRPGCHGLAIAEQLRPAICCQSPFLNYFLSNEACGRKVRPHRGSGIPDVERAKIRSHLMNRIQDRLGQFYLTLDWISALLECKLLKMIGVLSMTRQLNIISLWFCRKNSQLSFMRSGKK